MTSEITIVERSTSRIDAETYRRLDAEAAFWELLDRRVLSVERRGRRDVTLRAGPYVGRVLVGETFIRITEKVTGSLATLVRSVSGESARSLEAPSFVDRDEALLTSILETFSTSVEQYVRRGRRKVYRPLRSRSASPRGKILVDRTMRLWATGRRDQCAFALDDLSPNCFLNELIGAAVEIAATIAARQNASHEFMRRIRTLSLFFEDVTWRRLVEMPDERFDEEFERECPFFGDDVSVATLGRLFVRHFGIGGERGEDELPYSWFIKLELLFEEALRRSLARHARPLDLVVSDWRAGVHNVLAPGSRWRAEPDIVVRDRGMPQSVIDAKYKDISGDPDHGDVYQILCHADAWGVKHAVLVYPGSRTHFRMLGTSPFGVQIHVFTVDMVEFEGSCIQLLNSLRPSAMRIA